jgi:16S rRNA processing protein RimM
LARRLHSDDSRGRAGSSGLTVYTEEGRTIGRLEEVWNLPGNPVFVVRQEEKELLIPAAKDVVRAVNLPARTMTVRMIDGLDA